MGRHKALLPVPGHDAPLLAYIVTRIRQNLSLDRIVLVTNAQAVAAALPRTPDIMVVPDRIPGQGPLQGLATALSQVPAWAIVLGCDMPFVKPAVLQYLLDSREAPGSAGSQAVIPIVHGRAQVLHALYHVSCLPAIIEALDAGERRMTAIWPAIRVHTVPEDDLQHLDSSWDSFRNLNTPADWEVARQQLLSLRPR